MATSINSIRRAEANIKAYQGDTFCPVLTFTDSSGSPLDFTDVVFKMQIRKKTGELLQTLEMGDGISVTLPNIVSFSSVINIEKGTYEYDLQGTWDDETVSTIIGGSFEVIKEITT